MGAAVFLELLARDAAAVEYERPLVEARARRAPAEEIDELELAKRHALAVRATLERRRRREAELVACSTPPARSPPCRISTRCCRRSCGGRAGCSAPTWRT